MRQLRNPPDPSRFPLIVSITTRYPDQSHIMKLMGVELSDVVGFKVSQDNYEMRYYMFTTIDKVKQLLEDLAREAPLYIESYECIPCN